MSPFSCFRFRWARSVTRDHNGDLTRSYSVAVSAPECMPFLVSLPNSKGTKKATVVGHVCISFCAEVQETSFIAFTLQATVRYPTVGVQQNSLSFTCGAQFLTANMSSKKFVRATLQTFLCASTKANINIRLGKLSYEPGVPHVRSSTTQKYLSQNV